MTSHMALRAVVGITMTLVILALAGNRLSFLVQLVRSGKPAVGRLLDAPKRVQAEAFEVLGQRKLLKWTVPGFAHFFAQNGGFSGLFRHDGIAVFEHINEIFAVASIADFIAVWVPLIRGTLTKPAEQPISAPPGNTSLGMAW